MIALRGVLALGAVALGVLSAEPVPRWRELNLQARKAAEANQYGALRKLLVELQPLMPGNPRNLYNAAACDAKLGRTAEALAELQHLAATGLIYDLAADDDFAALRKQPQFEAVIRQMQLNQEPVSHSAAEVTLAVPDLIAEDLAFDPVHHRFLISSVREGKILTPAGTVFASADGSVLALGVDAGRNLLWATSAALPHCAKCQNKDEGKTFLLAFDLRSGALRQQVGAPAGTLGDLTISRHGDVFVSDGKLGAVYQLKRGEKSLTRIDPLGEFPSPQTPALSADERTLYIPDYVRGIAAMDLATHQVRWLMPADHIALSGIDGLYLYGNSLIAVQNGTNPPRVIRFSLDLQSQEVLEANTPLLGEPTHGTLRGNSFYFLTNSGWSQYDEQGKRKPGPPVVSAVRRIDLNRR